MPVRGPRPAVSREVKAVEHAGDRLERAANQLAAAYRQYASAFTALEQKVKRR